MKRIANIIIVFLLCVSCILFTACTSGAQVNGINNGNAAAVDDAEDGNESHDLYEAAGEAEKSGESGESVEALLDSAADTAGMADGKDSDLSYGVAEAAPAPAAAMAETGSPAPEAEAPAMAESPVAEIAEEFVMESEAPETVADADIIINRVKPAPGQLTAGEWSDIKNYDYYLNLLKIKTDDMRGIPENQRRKGLSEYVGYFGFETRYMLTVKVIGAVNDARVELYDSNQNKLFAARTDMRGNAYLFPPRDLNGETVTVKVNSGGFESSESFVYSEPYIEMTLTIQGNIRPILDLMFVVDTTGSMSDELEYLNQEIDDVISAVSRANANLPINLALLFYRDNGDEYVTKYFDFTTDIQSQQQNLSRQRSNGGGDFPEAADIALSEAVGQNWNGAGATRLIFHVCDAPPHDTQDSRTRYYNAIKDAAEKGIRIIPVASSGIDKATEYLLRQEAMISSGTYIFLTNESGIGGGHIDPTIGDYTVEYLNACIVRVINEYLTGTETEPVPFNR